MARQLTAALQAAVAEAAAAGRVEGSPAAWQHLLAARRLLEQAPVLDAAQLLQARSAQQQLGPELCAMLRDLETSAHEVWAAVSRALDAQGDEQRGQQIQQQQQQQQQYPLPSPIPIMPGQPPGLAPAPSFYFGAAQPQSPPPPPPQAQPVRPTLADVLDSIRAGSLTEALLRAGAWQEPDADSMFWEAAVQACDVEALQVRGPCRLVLSGIALTMCLRGQRARCAGAMLAPSSRGRRGAWCACVAGAAESVQRLGVDQPGDR